MTSVKEIVQIRFPMHYVDYWNVCVVYANYNKVIHSYKKKVTYLQQ